MIALLSFAHDFEKDGIYYKITSSAEPYTVAVTYQGSNIKSSMYIDEVKIPESVTYNGKTYSVTSIGNYAFWYCSFLTSITIPNSVTSIGSNATGGCSRLVSIAVENGNTMYDSRDNCNAIIETASNTLIEGCNNTIIPNSVTSIGNSAFHYCSGLTTVTIPNSVASIGDGAFSGCTGLTSVTIPNSVTSIGQSAFGGCSGLTSVIIGNGVTYIPKLAFSDCSSLTSITIGNSVTSIGDWVFSGCSSLNSITIPNSVTSLGKYVFGESNHTLKSIILPDNITQLWGIIGRDFESIPSTAKIYVNWGTKTLFELWFYGYKSIYKIGTEELLSPPTLSVLSTTQSTATLRIDNKDEGYTYTYNSKPISGDTFVAENLRPGYEYSISIEVSLNNYSYNPHKYVTTKGINPSVIGGATSASSIFANGSYTSGDAKIVKHEFSCNGKKIEGNSISVNGLSPNKSYDVSYIITVAYGDQGQYTASYTGKKNITTNALTLTTEQPKVVSLGNVIVSAKANVDDEETNVGFEWRRTDWTDDFKSNTGTANMYEGTMEGYIRNLNTDKLWKFRPYYLANDGTYYYGDWIGLDPTNTSYFEPTVHTYAKIDVTGNTALVKGYALGGTDNITVQGFKYWKAANLARAEYGDRADVTAVTIPANAQTIEAEGRVMEATLSGLDYESTYYYVAFAKTAEGTYYGDVKSFATGVNTTGIERIDNSQLTIDNSRRVKGIYTLTGVKVSDDAADVKTLPSGIYIVNGRRVAVK